MRFPTFAALAAAGCFVLTLAAPAAAAGAAGSGRVAGETRTVAGFDAISVAGPIDLVVRQGAAEALTLRAEDNLLPLIETVVEPAAGRRTLKIRVRAGERIASHKPIVATVDVVRLTAIAAAGSGDVTVEALSTPSLALSLAGANQARLPRLTTDAFELRISGSGDVTAAGSAKSIKLAIAGSGDADLAGLVADDVAVRIAGSGDANVTANKALQVSIAGSGDVRYGGSVTAVATTLAGSGTVQRR
jgi:hypothetical protein